MSPVHRAVAFWPDGKLLSLPSPQLPTDPQPVADRGKTKGGPRCFEAGDAFVDWNDPKRMRDGSRIDYVLVWPGPEPDAGPHIEFAQGRVVMQHLADGRDASDHYGLQYGLRSIRLRRPGAGP
jgi:hypothetical protein